MEENYYEAQWPKDGLFISCYIHEVMNFRYHWHPDDFELNLLLAGEQNFCRGTSTSPLSVDDVVLVDPNTSHASYGQSHGTLAMVLHFSASVFKPLVKKGDIYSFLSCLSDSTTKEESRYRKLRYYAAQTYMALASGEPFGQYRAKASTEMLIATLLNDFSPQTVPSIPEIDIETRRTMHRLMEYIEANYTEKISLEDIANFSQYTRTYISFLFRKTVGINFYEYLMRVRFQHALLDLTRSEKNLTEIALSNGFSELKSFNKRFREVLGCLPSEYRIEAGKNRIASTLWERNYIPFTDPVVHKKLMSYLIL